MSTVELGVAALVFGVVMFLMGFLGGYFHPFARRRVEPRDEAWQWVAEHYPKALVEMPTSLFREVTDRP